MQRSGQEPHCVVPRDTDSMDTWETLLEGMGLVGLQRWVNGIGPVLGATGWCGQNGQLGPRI